LSLFFVIVSALFFAAFFSGAEVAFVSSSRLKMELDRKKGKFPSGIVAVFARRPEQYFSTALAGYYIAMTVYGIAFVSAMTHHAPCSVGALAVSMLAAAFSFFLFADYLPKILFRLAPNAMMNACALPMLLLCGMMYPVTGIIAAASRTIVGCFTKFAPGKVPDEMIFSRTEPDDFLFGEPQPASKEEQDAEHEIKIFQNALDFPTVKLRDCMIPRTDIVAIEENASIAELKRKFVDTGLSKIVVYKEDIDNVTGYVHSKELFKNPPSIQSMLNQLTFVPETMSGNRMMQLFMQERRSIAIVVDEYGGTSGLLTLEDLIEEIFGDIEDEHDKDNLVERRISDSEYLFSGRLEIEYLNETFHLNIPEKDDYDTLAGFVLYHHLNLPLAGEMIRIEPFTLVIRKVTNTRIDLIQVTVNK